MSAVSMYLTVRWTWKRRWSCAYHLESSRHLVLVARIFVTERQNAWNVTGFIHVPRIVAVFATGEAFE